jgi:PAS domain S-box-containing protein
VQSDGDELGAPSKHGQAATPPEAGSAADERERLAQALRASEAHLRTAISASPAVVFSHDRELRYTWVLNPVPPLAPADLVGKTDADIFPPSEAQALTEIKRHVLEHGVALRRTVTATLEGRTRHYDIQVVPRRDGAGEIVGIDCATWDVTDRVETAAALRESERRFRAMADSMPQLVWTATAAGVVDYYNARAAEYAGLQSQPDGTWAWQPVLHPDDLDDTVAAWAHAVEHGTEYSCEHRVRMADGSYRWHLSRARLVRGQDGAPDRWFGTATDIHARRAIEDDLQRAIVTRDRVVSLVSHDLRNQLGVLRTSLALLRALPPPAPAPRLRGEGVLDRMDRQVVKMERVLDELLDVAKLQTGHSLALRRRPTDLVAIARELTHEHARSAPDHRVELRTGEPALLGHWDPDRLERVIGNLLSNAIKFSARGGVVEVEVARVCVDETEWAQLRVIDHGLGIPEQDRHRVFEWFARGHNVEHTVRGTGLGLAGAREIVEAHGGTITVRSKEGAGSTFIVRLPLDAGSAEPGRSATPARVVRRSARRSTTTAPARAGAPLRDNEFLGVLAHELRNPLAPIRTAMYILRTIEHPDPLLERTRAVIDRQVTHMSRLIDDLLDVSRLSRGKLELRVEPCDLAEIARQTTEDHRATLEARGLSVSLCESGEPLPVDGDPVRLSQMIGNLLHNAGRFSKQGDRVEVRIEPEHHAGLAVVTVVDTGVGIDSDVLPRVFEPFSQADQGLARTKGGLGLGLALTKGIAELHGGDVAAHSQGPGHGATFTLRIPLSPAR